MRVPTLLGSDTMLVIAAHIDMRNSHDLTHSPTLALSRVLLSLDLLEWLILSFWFWFWCRIELGRLFDLSNGAGQPMFVGTEATFGLTRGDTDGCTVSPRPALCYGIHIMLTCAIAMTYNNKGEGAVMGQGVGTTTAAATSGASAAWATPLSPGSFGRHSASQAVAIPSSRSGFGGLQAGAGEPEMGGLSLSPGGLSLSPGTSSLFDVSMDGGLGTSPTASSGRPFLALPSVESDDGIVDTFFGSEEAGSGGFGGGGGGGLQQQQRQQRFQQQQLALQQQQLRYQQQLQQQQYQLGSGSAPSYQSSIGFGSNIGASGLLGPLQPAALDLAGSAIPRPNDPKNNELWKRRMLHAEQQRYKAQVAAGHARTTFHAAGAGAGAAGAGMGMGGKGVGDAGTGGGHSAIVAYNPAAAAAQVKIKQEPRFTDTESKAREGAVGGGKGGAGRSRAGT